MAPALHVERRGRGGLTLVFLHAFASSAASWRWVIDRLEADHRCVALDLPGFGRSSPPAAYSVAGLAAAVLGQVTAEDCGPFVLVGHSMGGKLAMAAAACRPRGLAGLALIAPSPPTPEPITDDERAERRAAYGDAEAARATLDRITRLPVAGEDADRFVADALACSRSAWDWWLEAGSREDIGAAVARIDAPVRLLAGRDDPAFASAALNAPWLQGRSSAVLTLLPEPGHLLPIESPAACAAILRTFLETEASNPLAHATAAS